MKRKMLGIGWSWRILSFDYVEILFFQIGPIGYSLGIYRCLAGFRKGFFIGIQQRY